MRFSTGGWVENMPDKEAKRPRLLSGFSMHMAAMLACSSKDSTLQSPEIFSNARASAPGLRVKSAAEASA